MKKILIIIILILLVGCKNNNTEKLECNYQDSNREDKIIVNFKNNESVNYNKESTITFDDSKKASNYEYDDNIDKIEVVDNIVSMYTQENLDNMTKDEVKSLYEKSGYICK